MIIYKLQISWYVLHHLKPWTLRLPQPRPSALVLTRRVDRGSELQSSPQNEMRIPQELSAKKYDVCHALLQITICLFAVEDKSDGADLDVRKRLLDSGGKGNL